MDAKWKLNRTNTLYFDSPADLGDQSFLDVFSDLFTPPEFLPPSRPYYGFMAHIQDGRKIQEYFRKATAEIESDINS